MTPAAVARYLVGGAARLVWPPACLVCDVDLLAGHFCDACRAALLADGGDTCPRCASPVGPYVDLDGGCARCRGDVFHFAGAVRFGPYAGVLRDAVLKMKSGGGEVLAGRLGELWAGSRRDELLRGDPQVVVPVPLHWRRRWHRGYNQSDELALAVARVLGRPCLRRCLARTRHTPLQSAAVTPTERRENVRGRFRAGGRVRGLRVLLVDDVLTTGATADQCAVALLACGAAQVRVAALAHG